MVIHRLRSLREFTRYAQRYEKAHRAQRSLEEHLAISHQGGSFTVPGYSIAARQSVSFEVIRDATAPLSVNWRETVVCPVSGLNNRLRASVHLMESETGLCSCESLYVTEQCTPLYRHLSTRHGNLYGSEYLGSSEARGQDATTGLRNEDLTRLTFPDEAFDLVGCFECLEHIPDDAAAIRELGRVTKKGGRLLLSVPFGAANAQTLQRATLDALGNVVHHQAPEYHGDPLAEAGCLCYRHYGWDLIDQLRDGGFDDAYGVFYWSEAFGYLGAYQVVFVAVK